MNMEIAFITDTIKELNKLNNIDVLYFGNEFCQNKIPNLKQLKYCYDFCIKNNINFVLVLPFITNEKINFVNNLLIFLNSKKKSTEIIFNDWGTFTLISQYKNLQPVLGRLLNKQRKDPIAQQILDNTQPKIKVITEKSKQVIVQSKQVPKTLIRYFQQTYLNVPEVQKFMIQNNITRYEIDLVPWQNNLNINKKISLSVYYPYVNISTTRYCGAININYNSKCNKLCQKQQIVIGKKAFKYPYYIIGNAIFYKADINILKKELKYSKINRIVFNDIESLIEYTK